MHFIDIFAGAGGLSEGFIKSGFVPVAHVEMDKYASETLLTRTIYHHLLSDDRVQVYNDYLRGKIDKSDFYQSVPDEVRNLVIQREISNESIEDIFSKIDKNMRNMGLASIDLLIGGPPCQAYSLVGRARDPYRKEYDPRNFLYKQYVKFLRRYTPSMFVFENVPGILTAGKGALFADVKKYMDDAGYDIDAKVLDSSEFGVLQKRKRVILIGWKKGSEFDYPEFERCSISEFTVRNLLSDLPPLQPGEMITSGDYSAPPTKYLLQSSIRTQGDILTQHITRSHNLQDREIYRMAITNWKTHRRRLKYTELPEELRTHKNLISFLDRFKVVVDDEQFSHTMVAHISKDGHYYIHPDIEQARSLSVREAARIQSFPDNYYFEGPRTAMFVQIGNAVPPFMAEKIADSIKRTLMGVS